MDLPKFGVKLIVLMAHRRKIPAYYCLCTLEKLLFSAEIGEDWMLEMKALISKVRWFICSSVKWVFHSSDMAKSFNSLMNTSPWRLEWGLTFPHTLSFIRFLLNWLQMIFSASFHLICWSLQLLFNVGIFIDIPFQVSSQLQVIIYSLQTRQDLMSEWAIDLFVLRPVPQLVVECLSRVQHWSWIHIEGTNSLFS